MPFHLDQLPSGLQLCKSGERGGAMLRAQELDRRLKQGKKLLLARACLAGPGTTVFDATGGFGLDGLTLAALGCEVILCERHPLVVQLLEDGVRRLGPPREAPGEARVLRGEALHLLEEGGLHDIVYLDPIFPERNKSALPNKRARLLAELVGQEVAPLEPLLRLARERARKRVVVKRRLRDPEAAAEGALAPAFSLKGKSVRFDVYLPEAA